MSEADESGGSKPDVGASLKRALADTRDPIDKLIETVEGIVAAGRDALTKVSNEAMTVTIDRVERLFKNGMARLKNISGPQRKIVRRACYTGVQRRARKLKVTCIGRTEFYALADAADPTTTAEDLLESLKGEPVDEKLLPWVWFGVFVFASSDSKVVELRENMGKSACLMAYQQAGDSLLVSIHEDDLAASITTRVQSAGLTFEKKDVTSFLGYVVEDLVFGLFCSRTIDRRMKRLVAMVSRGMKGHRAALEPLSTLLQRFGEQALFEE